MSPRFRLPQRRPSTTFSFCCGARAYTATFSYFPDTQEIAEIFLSNGRAGSDLDAACKDSAVVCSIALQHGTPLNTIRHALLRDASGIPASPLGAALDFIELLHNPERTP